MNKKTAVAAVTLIVVLIVACTYAYAQYVMTSNSLNHNSTERATILLSQNATTSVVGDTVVLTATCTDASYTGTVTFLDGSTALGTATASGGVAVFNVPINQAKTWTFTATATHT